MRTSPGTSASEHYSYHVILNHPAHLVVVGGAGHHLQGVVHAEHLLGRAHELSLYEWQLRMTHSITPTITLWWVVVITGAWGSLTSYMG